MTQEQKKATTGRIFMLMASLCFSTGGLMIKLIPWNPLAINGARNLIACCIIGSYAFLLHHRIRFNFTIFVGAVCMFGVTTFFTIATKMTSAGNAIILQYTGPIWIMLLMFIFIKKKPTKLEIVTILIVMGGILCFFFESLSSGKWLGDLIALLSGVFYAGVFMLNQFKKGDALSSMFLGQLMSGVLLTPMVCFETSFGPGVLLPVLVLGVIQLGVAYIFLSIGTSYTDPVTASIINAFEPILNPVLVALFYGEMLGKMSVIGAVIVIGGVLFYSTISSSK